LILIDQPKPPNEKLPKMIKIRETEIFQKRKFTSVISEFCNEKTTIINTKTREMIVLAFMI